MRNRKAVLRSNALRIDMTPPERRLWYRLNRRQLDGVKFRHRPRSVRTSPISSRTKP